jgi:hypothetical protein
VLIRFPVLVLGLVVGNYGVGQVTGKVAFAETTFPSNGKVRRADDGDDLAGEDVACADLHGLLRGLIAQSKGVRCHARPSPAGITKD